MWRRRPGGSQPEGRPRLHQTPRASAPASLPGQTHTETRFSVIGQTGYGPWTSPRGLGVPGKRCSASPTRSMAAHDGAPWRRG